MKTNHVTSTLGFRISFVIRHSSFVIISCFLLSSSSASTNLSTTLQQALFEEEANHNLTAAIQSYQSLIIQFDQDRKLAATAVFRLGECYRKQGNTNDASAQYQRVVREFSDQSTLLDLSRQNLAALGIAPPSPASSATTTAARAEQKRFFEEEIKLVEKQLASHEMRVKTGTAGKDEAIPIQRDLLKLRRQLAALDAGQAYTDSAADSGANLEAERRALDARIAELKALPKERLRIAIQQSSSNPVLNTLMEQLTAAEQRLATVNNEFGPEHIESRNAKTQVETVSKQIDTQVDAAMEALMAKRNALAGASQSSRSTADVAGATSAEDEEVRRIQALIKDSPDLINSVAAGGLTLLQAAASKGELSIVKLLLENGAAVDGVRQQDFTPLHYAAGNGRKAVVDFLLSKGAKVSAQAYAGVTPLHLAAGRGYELVAKTLLQAHASVNAPTTAQSAQNPFGVWLEQGQTPLHAAIYGGYSAIVQLLIKSGADPNIEDGKGRTPLSYAVDKPDFNVIVALGEARANPNAGSRELPLLVAAHNGDVEVMETLLKWGANPNTNGLTGWGDGKSKYSPLALAVQYHHPEAIKTLIRFKADPNILNSQRNPIIFDALSRRDLDTLKALLDNGANPNVLAQDGYTPLATAVNGHDNPAVETLLAHHADPNQKIEATFGEGGKGYTPLLIATAKVLPDLVDVLLAAGADPDLRSEIRAPFFNVMNNENPPARKRMAASLLDHGAKPDVRDTDGRTPLMYAIFRNDKETAALLLAHKADVNAAARDGGTALHFAVANNHPDLVELLLANKADPNMRNNAGQTPLDLTRGPTPPGLPAPNYPGIPSPIPTRTLRLPGASTATAEAETAPVSLADLLRQHGAAEELPEFSLIRVSRKGMGPRQIFKQDTNSFNRFTLFETLATASYLNIQYPDFSQLRIHRPDPAKPGKSKEIRVNPMLTPTTFDCAKDTWLELGDIVEIPEREHTLTEDRNYGSGGVKMDTLTKCLARKVKFVVRDQSIELALLGYNFETYLASAMQQTKVQNILRSSSDFSHVHVKRTDPETQKTREFTVDVQSIWFNKSPRTDDLWLRDGDIIEVPDKTE